MIDVIDNLVGAYRQVILQLGKETLHLMFINMAEPSHEIILHQDNALGRVLHVGNGDVGVALLVSQQFAQEVCAYFVHSLFESSSFSHSQYFFK